jgi:hypothetical protein
LAETVWSSYVGAFVPRAGAVFFAALAKLPLWLGVALVALPLLRPPDPSPRMATNVRSVLVV